ncbi:hypothetical protein PIROE2DRAFT_15871, partial [Piromyces sp. E2]
MHSVYEINTENFYNELNNACNPEKLLQIAKQGIFLYESLFKHSKIKDHEYVVEISILAGQHFMINNIKQYNRFKEILLSKTSIFLNCIPPPNVSPNDKEMYLELLIPNIFFIDQFINDTDKDFKKVLFECSLTLRFWLYYFCKYKYINPKEFALFYRKDKTTIKFAIFEYLYYNNSEYLDNLFRSNNDYCKVIIVNIIINNYMNDINLLNYCVKVVKKYKIICEAFTYRLPPKFPLHILKQYNNLIFMPNNLYVKCKNDKMESLINNVCSDSTIKSNSMDTLNTYIERFDIYEKIQRDKINIIENTNKNENLLKLYEKYKDEDGEINYNFIYSFINNINTYRFTSYYVDYDCIFDVEEIDFVKNYLYKYDFIKNLLDNPKFIFDLKIDYIMTGIEKEIINVCYIVSLLHNKVYNISIIEYLFYTLYSINFARIKDNKIFFRCYESDMKEDILYNTGVEEIAALILSASTNDGKIKRNSDGSEIKINISVVGEDAEDASIIDIIPGLRRIKNKYEMRIADNPDISDKLKEQMKIELDWKFKRLVDLSLDVYTKHFGTEENPKHPINNYDVIRYLTEKSDISLFNENFNTNIFDPADDDKNKLIRDCILEENKNNQNNIINKIFTENVESQMNDNEKIKKIISGENKDIIKNAIKIMYDLSNKEYINRQSLFENIISKCRGKDFCKKLFQSQSIKFLIIESTNEDTELYSLIIKDNTNEKLIHAFTLEKSNNNYEINEKYGTNKAISFNEIKNISQNYGKTFKVPDEMIQYDEDILTKNSFGIEEQGVGLLAECEIVADKQYKYLYIDEEGNKSIYKINGKNQYYNILYGAHEYGIYDENTKSYKKNNVNSLILDTWTAKEEDINNEYLEIMTNYNINSKNGNLYILEYEASKEIFEKYRDSSKIILDYEKSKKEYDNILKYYSEESINAIVKNFNNNDNNKYTEENFIYDVYTKFKAAEEQYNINSDDDNIKKYEIAKSIYENYVENAINDYKEAKAGYDTLKEDNNNIITEYEKLKHELNDKKYMNNYYINNFEIAQQNLNYYEKFKGFGENNGNNDYIDGYESVKKAYENAKNTYKKAEAKIKKRQSIPLYEEYYNKKQRLNKIMEENENIKNYDYAKEKYYKIEIVEEYEHAKILYDIKENIKCSDSNKKYIDLNEIIKLISEKYNGAYKEKVLNLIKVIVLEKMFPTKLSGNSEGINISKPISIIASKISERIGENKEIHSEDGHYYNIKNYLNLILNIDPNQNMCSITHIQNSNTNINKRGENCSYGTLLNTSDDNIKLINDILTIFDKKQLISENILNKENIDLSNIDILWEEFANIYENNIEKFNIDESQYIVASFNELYSILNTDKFRLESAANTEVLKGDIHNMKNLLSKVRNIHDSNYKFEILNDKMESLKNEFNNVNTNDNKELISKISILEMEIFEEIKKFKQIENPNNYYKESVKLVELLNNNNELIHSVIDPIYLYNDNELTNKLKYLVAEKYIKALSNILENNKEKFNIDKDSSVESLISNAISVSDKKIKFSEGHELPEINLEILNKIFNKNFNSEVEVVDYILNNISDRSQLDELKESYELKRKLMEHEAPSSRNENEVNIMNEISKKFELSNNDIQIKTFQNVVYDSFLEFLEGSSKFDDYVRFENLKNDENGNLDISDTYINSKGRKVIKNDISKLFGKLNTYVTALVKAKGLGQVSDEEFNKLKNNIEISVIKLKDFITTYVNELSKSIDKENVETFDNALSYLENIVNSASSFIASATNLCENEYLKDDISEALDNLNALKNLNNEYKKETKTIPVKSVTISVPKFNTEKNNSDETYDQMNLEEKILKALKNLKSYDSKNIKVKNDENRIQNPGNLYVGTNTLIDIVKKSLETYTNNINNISDVRESREILINLYDAINILVNRYAKSDYIEDITIKFLNEDLLHELSSLFDKSFTLHNAKFNEKLKDNNGNEIANIIDHKSIAETKSKYVNDMLHDIYSKLFNIFDTDEFNKGLRDNMELDSNNKVSKVYNDNREAELKYLLKKLSNYDINSNDKEYQKEELLSIYKQLSEIEEIFDRENSIIDKNSRNDFVNNSKAVYSLSNSLFDVMKNNFNDDDEIQKLRTNYNSKIGNINKSDIETKNVLNLDYLIKNTESNDFIKDPNYKPYINSYFTYLKHRLLDTIDNENDRKTILNKIEMANNDINEKIKLFNSYDSPEGHYEEAEHLIELTNNLNDLISFCVENDIKLDNIDPINLNGDGELSNRLNYIRVKLMIDTFDEIAKAHPDIFKLKNDKSLADYIDPSGGSSYYSFGSYSIREPVERDLQSIIRNVVESKHDATVTFVDNTTNNYQIMQLERSFGMKYKLIIHESSFYRIKDEVEDMNKILKNKHFISRLKNKCFKRLETFDQTKKRLDATLVNLAKLTNIDIDNTDSETIISQAKELALIIKVSGKVSSDVFQKIYDHSLAFNKVSMDAITAIEFKSSSINDDNKLEKAKNFNNKFNENVSSNKIGLYNELPNSSSINKPITNSSGHHNTNPNPNPNHNGGTTIPGHGHKSNSIPGKIKRNRVYIKFCLYTSNSMIKMVNPFYINSQNETIYFDNIEEYAKYIGPDWTGVGICGEDKVVNNIGEYFTVMKSDKLDKRSNSENDNKKSDSNADNDSNENNKKNLVDKSEENIYRHRTLEEYKEYYKKLLDALIDNRTDSVSLTSRNPAYNPYHPLLVHADNIKGTNVITILEDEENNDFGNCEISANNMEKSSMTCTVTYSRSIQNTISISTSKGIAYHTGNGINYGEGDSVTDEIGASLEIARALTKGNSVSYNKSDGGSVSLENVHTVVNTKSLTKTDSSDHTHTDTHENSYVYTVSEETSHSRSDGGEIVDETNWSDYTENSKSEEYSRMNYNDYKNAEKMVNGNEKMKDDIKNVKELSEKVNKNVLSSIRKSMDNKSKSKRSMIVDNKNLFNSSINKLQKRTITRKPNKINTSVQSKEGKGGKVKQGAQNFLDGCTGGAGLGGTLGSFIPGLGNLLGAGIGCITGGISNTIMGAWQGAEADRTNDLTEKQMQQELEIAENQMKQEREIAEEQMKHEAKLAREQEIHDIVMAVAGTHNTGSTNTTGHSTGGSHSEAKNWSDMYTNTSGVSNSWSTTDGYSDAYTTGHSETSTEEESISDSNSVMLTSTFNEDHGWVNDESSTNTTSTGYSYGRSTQKNYNVNLSYDEAIDISAQNSYEITSSTTDGKILNKSVNFNIPGNKCYILTTLPVFFSEVIIWATGSIDKYNITHINYNKSITPIEFSHFSGTAVECDQYISPKEQIYNSNEQDFIFIKQNDKNGSTANTLRSGEFLSPNKFITTGNYSFGLTSQGELKLCKSGTFTDDCTALWTNGLNNVPQGHDLKFFIGDNGHLYITAKDIYREIEDNVKYPKEYIDLLEAVINDNEVQKSKEDIEKLKKLVDKYEKNKNSLNKRFRPEEEEETEKVEDEEKEEKENKNLNTLTKTTPTSINDNTTSTINIKTTTVVPSTTTTSNTNPNNLSFELDDNEYIIWDSLPKNLPFNVGYPDKTGYYLYIKDGKTAFDGASVILYDGAGVKIWEISAGDDYKGYSYPKEYMYPLNFNTNLNINKKVEEIDYSDLHTVIEPIIEDEYMGYIEMKCGETLNQNRALISENGRYKFYVQDSGNMVIKEDGRTMWSSMTANIELFEPPYHIAFSPIGEFILRDKNNYSVWQSLNALAFANNKKIDKEINFYLSLSNEGELFVEDDDGIMYWSNWDVRLYSEHLRYVNPVIYEISTCDEHIKPKMMYEIFANPGIYNYYVDPNTDISYKRKYYFNNLKPGEKLLSYSSNAYLDITDNDVIFHYDSSTTLVKSCSHNDGINELRLDNDGLYLVCNNNKELTIVDLDNKKLSKVRNYIRNSKVINRKDNPYIGDYNRLGIEYRKGMDHPDLMIFNVLTWEPLWGLNPVRYLNSVKDDKIKKDGDRIIQDNKFNTFDRLISTDGNSDFIYMSSNNGLEFKHSSMPLINEISLSSNNLYINTSPMIINNVNMELRYSGEFDKLIIKNDTYDNVWELYGTKKCDIFISNDNNCNVLYSYNHLNITFE